MEPMFIGIIISVLVVLMLYYSSSSESVQVQNVSMAKPEDISMPEPSVTSMPEPAIALLATQPVVVPMPAPASKQVDATSMPEPAIALLATPAVALLKDGQSVMCNETAPLGPPGAVFRYTGNNTVNWYTDPAVAQSWDPAWSNPMSIDCTGLTQGSNMILKS